MPLASTFSYIPMAMRDQDGKWKERENGDKNAIKQMRMSEVIGALGGELSFLGIRNCDVPARSKLLRPT